jgi:hypothetical protein
MTSPPVIPLATPESPAASPAQARVDAIAARILAANAPLGLKPRFVVGPGTGPPVREGSQRVVLSEASVNACTTDGQLASLISWQMAHLYVERRQLREESTRLNREPPPSLNFGHDSGTFGPADGYREIELVALGLERRRRQNTTAVPPPDPAVVARQILVQSGYSEFDLASSP